MDKSPEARARHKSHDGAPEQSCYWCPVPGGMSPYWRDKFAAARKREDFRDRVKAVVSWIMVAVFVFSATYFAIWFVVTLNHAARCGR